MTPSFGGIAVVSAEKGKHNAEASWFSVGSSESSLLYRGRSSSSSVVGCDGIRNSCFFLYPGNVAIPWLRCFENPSSTARDTTTPLPQSFTRQPFELSTITGHSTSVSVLYNAFTESNIQRILERLWDTIVRFGLRADQNQIKSSETIQSSFVCEDVDYKAICHDRNCSKVNWDRGS